MCTSAAREIIDIRNGQRARPDDPFLVHADPFSGLIRKQGTSAGGTSIIECEIIRSEGPPKHHYPPNGSATGLRCGKVIYFRPRLVRRFDIIPDEGLYLTWPCCGYLNLRQGCAMLCAILARIENGSHFEAKWLEAQSRLASGYHFPLSKNSGHSLLYLSYASLSFRQRT